MFWRGILPGILVLTLGATLYLLNQKHAAEAVILLGIALFVVGIILGRKRGSGIAGRLGVASK